MGLIQNVNLRQNKVLEFFMGIFDVIGWLIMVISLLLMLMLILASTGSSFLEGIFKVGSMGDNVPLAIAMCMLGTTMGIIIIISSKTIGLLLASSQDLEELKEINDRNFVRISENLRMFKEQATNFLSAISFTNDAMKEMTYKQSRLIEMMTKNLTAFQELNIQSIEHISDDSEQIRFYAEAQAKLMDSLNREHIETKNFLEQNLEYIYFIADQMRESKEFMFKKFGEEKDFSYE